MNFIPITIDRFSQMPIYQQLAQTVRAAIENGSLQRGSAMPSSRKLAEHLKISRPTACATYELLISQGLLVVEPKIGTFVAQTFSPQYSKDGNLKSNQSTILETAQTYRTELSELSRWLNNSMVTSSSDLAKTSTTPEDLQLLNCKSLFSTRLHNFAEDVFGLLQLRLACSDYLQRVHHVSCHAQSLAVFSNSFSALNVLLASIIKKDDFVALENPCDPRVRKLFQAHGARIVGIPIDNEGIVVSRLAESGNKYKLVYVTPSCNAPTGVQMSLARRRELIDWCEQSSALIVEDERESHVQNSGRKLPSIKSMANEQLLVQLTDFNQVVDPIVRLAILALPQHLIGTVSNVKSLFEPGASYTEQIALAALLKSGSLERHIGKIRKLYSDRNRNLTIAVTSILGKRARLYKTRGSTHMLTHLSTPLPAEQVEAIANLTGVNIRHTGRFYIGPSVAGQFMLPYAQTLAPSFFKNLQAMAFLMADAEFQQTVENLCIKEPVANQFSNTLVRTAAPAYSLHHAQ